MRLAKQFMLVGERHDKPTIVTLQGERRAHHARAYGHFYCGEAEHQAWPPSPWTKVMVVEARNRRLIVKRGSVRACPYAPKISPNHRRIGMVDPERFLPDRQRALVERPRAGEVALGLKQKRELVETSRRIAMVSTETIFDRTCRHASKSGDA
jgi:hypothetical protein